ncbi:LptF/LptG family permease [Mucilaginibacter sp. OK098]|uniref:LptF/LptG family permease n=1 Tax=Mucilaginibacter sp. OK098 TaxID=1855297 RepID=UPI00091B1C1C|nr:LptF/LptG family permease [Mucilaginibacter sp. OK098]SHN29026.1 lipopolysaccharide export system permease protein [Mucilaginibacter sp. OK098]
MKAILNRYLKTIDWYIINKYLGTFVFTLGIFVVITVVFDISEHLDNFLKNHSTVQEIIFKYYAGFIPFYMNLLSPLINFLAVIYFTAKMANQTEIVPILSGKASFNRFLRPYFVCATLIFIVSLFANIYLIPFTNNLKITFENSHQFNGDDPTKSEVHIQLDKHTFVYVQSFDNTIHTGYQFILEKFDGDVLREKLVANTIVYDSLKRVWTIKNYTIKYVNGLKEKYVDSAGKSKDTVLDMRPVDFIVYDNVYTAMSTKDLNRNIEKEKIRGTGALKEMLYEKYRRFVYPLSSYVLTLIGVSISSRKVRGGIGLPLGIGIFLCFAYIVIDRFALVFAVKGSMIPLIAVCMPNGIFALVGLYLLSKAPK